VADDETAPQLEERLARLGAGVLAGMLGPWLEGRVVPVPQPTEGATTTRPLRREDGRVDWARDAAALERQVRAYQPWPGTFTPSPLGNLTLWRVAVVAGDPAEADRRDRPGMVIPWGRGLAVVCGSGAIEVVEVQLAGRGRMSGRDLRNGYPGLVGERLS